MQSLQKYRLLVIGTGLAVLVFTFVFVTNVNTRSVFKQNSQGPDPVVEAVRRGGLREAAKIKGHYVSTERTTGWEKYDLEALTQTSSEIIVGTPHLSSSSLTSSGDSIASEYQVRIDQTLKGKLKENRLISIEVPGGKVTFDDGTSAEIKTPDLGPIVENESYVWFLKPKDRGAEVFQLIGGGQGLFELSDSESGVKPRGDKVDVVQKHKGQPVVAFLEDIRVFVKKHPHTVPCCN